MDSSGFLDSKEGLIRTEKYACWHQDDSTYNFIRRLDSNNWLRKVMDEKRPPDGSLCLLDSTFEENTVGALSRRSAQAFLLMNRLSATYALGLLSNFNKDKVIFLNSFIDTELLQVIYTSKVLEENTKRRLRSKLVAISESGLLINLYEQFLIESVATITSGKFYTNVQSLVDDSTKVADLEVDYFSSLLLKLFGFCSATFLAFIIHVAFKFFKKRGRRLFRFAFNRYKLDLDIRIVLKCPTIRFE